MSDHKFLGAEEYLTRMRISELLTHDEVNAAFLKVSAAGTNRIWPAMSGNEIYALANACAEAYRLKAKP